MSRHDYNFPADWEEMSDAEKCRWYTQERCRRQAMRQDTPAGRALRKQAERIEQEAKTSTEQQAVEPPSDSDQTGAEGLAS